MAILITTWLGAMAHKARSRGSELTAMVVAEEKGATTAVIAAW